VGDEARASLNLQRFAYSSLIAERGEAVRRVQLAMLKDVKRRHPYYWASFIQSGEWANLEGKR
jgi:CHAT domain-containing protein